MNRFRTPQFDAFEFDPGCLAVESLAEPARRWFHHWDGLVGLPAEEVTLAWAAGATIALVATSGRSFDRDDARMRAAHLAVAGSTLARFRDTTAPSERIQEMQTIGSAAALWNDIGGAVMADRGTEISEFYYDGGVTVAHAHLTGGPWVFFATENMRPADLLARRVDNWHSYEVDGNVVGSGP